MSVEAVRTAGLATVISKVKPTPFEAPPDLLDLLPVAVFACRSDGTLLWYNARAADLWGCRPSVGDLTESYCNSYKVYFKNGSVPREETATAMVLRTGRPIRGAEAKIDRLDGSVAWAMVHIDPIEDKGGTIIGTVTCLHESAGPPLQQERRLAASYEQAGIGIVEIDAEGRMSRVNAHLRRLLGFEPSELLGHSIFGLTHDDDAVVDRAQYARQVAGEIDGYSLDKRIRCKDGSHVWASITSRSVCDSEGRFLYAVRVQQDISERKRAEEALAKQTDEQAALHQLTASLQHADSLDEVYASAMHAIMRALRCDRASVLLFDDAGRMRFVAASGLSAAYCAAVDGHSPWSRETVDPEPISLVNVERADLAESLKASILHEGIAALAFVPLLGSGRLLGKFMVYYDQPHEFTAHEIDVATTIAHHVGFGVERMRAQRAALQLAAIVESSEDAIVSKDLNSIITSWNAGAERLFGYTAAEAIGRPITLVIPSDRLDEEPQIVSRIRRGERVEHFETIRRRKDGSLIDISLTISPVKDARGRIVGASKIARDITDQKAAEAKLRENEQQLQDLLSAIPAAIYTTDAQGRIQYYNEAAVELAGREPTLGSDEWCVTWKLYTPDGKPLPHDQCPMAVALREGRAIRGVEALAERPDGSRVPIIPYPTPIRNAKGEIVGAINMLVDISQRKEAETQQRVLLSELNHRVKNNMQMLQSLLSTSARKTKSAEARKTLEEATARVFAMAAAQRVLYGSTGATRFSAPDFLRSVVETVQQTFPQGLHIECHTDAVELGNDVAMPLALILNELLTNAVKHGDNLRSGKPIGVALTCVDDGYMLCVENDGPDFSLEAAHDRTSGLMLVEGLARQLGGKFTIANTPRQRCMVVFEQATLP